MTQLVLRTCKKDGSSYNGFKWPLEVGAEVVAPDWDPTPVCGGGLHGLLYGEGNGNLLGTTDYVWMVVEVPHNEPIVHISGKVKFRRCFIRYIGEREDTVSWLVDKAPGHATAYTTVTAGDCGTATAGYKGTAMAGDSGTAMAGDYGTARAGDYGTATAGTKGTAMAGTKGTAMAGNYGTATAGTKGTATAGDSGTAMAGDDGTARAGTDGTAMAGDGGTAMAGDGGTAMAGDYGTATAGSNGVIVIKYWDCKRYRLKIAYVGEDNIKANTKYRFEYGNFVEIPTL